MQHRSLKTQQREIERLVRKAQEGSHEAFSQLYDIFVNPLYRYVFFRINGPDVEDVLAVIFVKIWSNIGKFRFQEQPFSAWAFRIAHNVVVDFYRAHSSIDQLSDGIADNRQENISSNLAEKSLNNETLKKAMKHLKDDYQRIIILKFMNEMENAEIAEILGKSENSLRILQFRALKALRKILQNMGVTELL